MALKSGVFACLILALCVSSNNVMERQHSDSAVWAPPAQSQNRSSKTDSQCCAHCGRCPDFCDCCICSRAEGAQNRNITGTRYLVSCREWVRSSTHDDSRPCFANMVTGKTVFASPTGRLTKQCFLRHQGSWVACGGKACLFLLPQPATRATCKTVLLADAFMIDKVCR